MGFRAEQKNLLANNKRTGGDFNNEEKMWGFDLNIANDRLENQV